MPVKCLFFLVLVIVSCGVTKPDYIIYCKKGDPSSIRIIPKREQFTPLIDSFVSVKRLTVSNVKAFTPEVSIEVRRLLKTKVEELDSKTYFNIESLHHQYTAFRSRPCDNDAYKNYVASLDKITELLLNVKTLNREVEKITSGGGINGTNPSALLDLITSFIIKNQIHHE